MRIIAFFAALTTPAAADPISIAEALGKVEKFTVQAEGQVHSDSGILWIDTLEGDRFTLNTALPRSKLERLEACRWPDGCPVQVEGALRFFGGQIEFLAETVTFK